MNTDIYVYILIIIIIIVILYYLFIYNSEPEDTIVVYKAPNNVIPKFSNDNIKIEDKYEEKKIDNKGYVKDLLTKPDNTTNEYAKQFSTNISEPIDPNSIGFCPNAKEEKKALPFANMNVNVLLSNPPQ